MKLAFAGKDSGNLGWQRLVMVRSSNHLVACRPYVFLGVLFKPLLGVSMQKIGVLQKLINRKVLGLLEMRPHTLFIILFKQSLARTDTFICMLRVRLHDLAIEVHHLLATLLGVRHVHLREAKDSLFRAVLARFHTIEHLEVSLDLITAIARLLQPMLLWLLRPGRRAFAVCKYVFKGDFLAHNIKADITIVLDTAECLAKEKLLKVDIKFSVIVTAILVAGRFAGVGRAWTI
jgi:hypothetical protein